jgi:DNA helicase-2/ATP-dependent DNA helicase PcrA
VRDRDAETTEVQAERKRLEEVLIELEAQIEEATRDVEKNKRVVTGTQSHISDEYFSVPKSFSQLVDLAGGMGRLRLAGVMLRRSLDRVKQLKRLARSAYFGRIDFRETGSHVHPIYIGVSSLTARETGEHLVFDWRTPVSSVYYDYELGEANYESPAGTVYGEVLLKRHFKVRGKEILLMYDNDLTIFDEILQDTLGKATGDRMKAIVNTIQREQNRVIREEGRRLLLVQGAAGSGKTSIALHRAAYLLYKHRDRMSSHDILMVTPNRIFEDYTSPVLPELGEEPLTQSSFADLARDLLRPEQAGEPDAPGEADHKLEDLADQLEYLLDLRGTPGADTRSAGVRLKSDEAFARVLESYADNLTSGDLGFPGLVCRGQVLMSAREAADLVFKEYTYLPFVRRIEKAKRRMMWILDRARSKRYEELRQEIASDPNEVHLLQKDIKEQAARRASEEFEPLRRLVCSFRPVSFLEAYRRLYAETGLLKRLLEGAALGRESDDRKSLNREIDAYVADDHLTGDKETSAQRRFRPDDDVLEAIRRDTIKRLDSGVVPYEDLGPLLYLKGLLEGLPQSTGIRHVIVDEAQDYGALQFRVLRMAFPNASFTVLGDLNQTLSPAHVEGGGTGYEGAIRGLGAGKDTELVRLEKSYRSTKEITEFTKAILREGQPVEPIERPGERPLVIRAKDRDSLAGSIAADIRNLQDEGFRSIAVICRTARESWTAYESLKAKISQAEDTSKGNPDSASRASRSPGGIRLVSKHQRKFIRGALVIPSYLAKGLEFEAVIIYDAGDRSYGHPDDRLVLYTACTRALHRLHIYHIGRISPVLADVEPSLYQRDVHSAARAY